MGVSPYVRLSFNPYHVSSQRDDSSQAHSLSACLSISFTFALLWAALYCLFQEWGCFGIRLRLSFVDIVATLSLLASSVYLLQLFGVAHAQIFLGKHIDHPLVVKDGTKISLVQGCTVTAIPPGSACAEIHQPISQGKVLTDNNDDDIARAVSNGTLASHSLEAELGNPQRAASVRKRALELMIHTSLDTLPLHGFDYGSVLGQCCEMVIGYVQIPVGVAGPLLVDGLEYMVPMATTEGCLVASTNRGCKAIRLSGGASSILLRDGMTRAPVVRFLRAQLTAELKFYVEDTKNWETLCDIFNRTSRFAKLRHIQCTQAGRNLYMRFVCTTGDAMGMNMVSKGVQSVLEYLQSLFPDMEIVSISGNFCADKKAAAINWIEGRGKSIVCEAIIKGEVVAKILKTTVAALVELNMLKNLAGSAIAGALGGFNAHASNIVTAIFIATGQDPAQNVESSQCITMMESTNDGQDLHVSVSMPSIEVGTVGGGTQLASQSACLNLLGVKGPNKESPGANAQCLARIVAGTVLAGELSLLSALAAGHLVQSHMRLNRSRESVQQDVAIDYSMNASQTQG